MKMSKQSGTYVTKYRRGPLAGKGKIGLNEEGRMKGPGHLQGVAVKRNRGEKPLRKRVEGATKKK